MQERPGRAPLLGGDKADGSCYRGGEKSARSMNAR